MGIKVKVAGGVSVAVMNGGLVAVQVAGSWIAVMVAVGSWNGGVGGGNGFYGWLGLRKINT